MKKTAILLLLSLFIAASANKASYSFTLTDCIGKKLTRPATFTINTQNTVWKLDFNNGTSILYSIISGNSTDPMCGLKSKDSFGDKCEICIKPNGSNVTITFDYAGKKLVYTGYIQR